MVDIATWSRLDEAARQEFLALSPAYRASLLKHGVHDGEVLHAEWSVQSIDKNWGISNGKEFLEGIISGRREVIEALYTDGVQNLNR